MNWARKNFFIVFVTVHQFSFSIIDSDTLQLYTYLVCNRKVSSVVEKSSKSPYTKHQQKKTKFPWIKNFHLVLWLWLLLDFYHLFAFFFGLFPISWFSFSFWILHLTKKESKLKSCPYICTCFVHFWSFSLGVATESKWHIFIIIIFICFMWQQL